MRLWSLHPCYLDAKGLIALWREALLARAVLMDRTRGYRHHRQMERFRLCPDPVAAINGYLRAVYEESRRRGFRFDGGKLEGRAGCAPIPVTAGQMGFELDHLKRKLKARDREGYGRISTLSAPKPHPLFEVVEGGIEAWEKGAGRPEGK